MSKTNITAFAFMTLLILLALNTQVAQAQGSVVDVTVTTSVSSMTVPVFTKANYKAAVTTGTPKPGNEWKVIGPATYSWSTLPDDTVNPSDTSETTLTTHSLLLSMSGNAYASNRERLCI